MSLFEEQIITLHEVISQFRGLQDTLPTQLQEIHETLAMQEQQINNLNNINIPKESNDIKVRSPSPFDGKSQECSTFFSQLAVYFAANGNYNTDEKKIMFAISCVSGPVSTFLEPFVSQLGQQPKPDILTNYETFKTNLTNAFGDPDPIVTAETQLRRLRQDKLSVSIYATRFRMHAQNVQWNDAALMSQFKVNLCQTVQDELARRPAPKTLDLLIFEAMDIDNKLIRRPKELRNISSNNENRSSSDSAMDIDPRPNQASQISQEERDRRNQSRSCYYCGDHTHFKRDCPKINHSLSGHSLNTFVLNAMVSPCHVQPKFSDLPPVQVLADTTKFTHVQISHAPDNNLLYVPLVFGTSGHDQVKRIPALLDTGASMSVASQDLVNSLCLQGQTVSTSASFIVGNGQYVASSSKLNAKIRLSDSKFHSEVHEFYVVKDCSFQVILGLDWIRKHSVSIDFDNKTTQIKCANTLKRLFIESTPTVSPCATFIESSRRIQTIQNWQPGHHVQDIQAILGLTNVYRKFIKSYSKICAPFIAILKQNATSNWSSKANQAFNSLKTAILSDPVFSHYDFTRPCIIETEVSDFALSAICSQVNSSGVICPVAIFSRMLLPAEHNYQVYDKELSAIIMAFKHWRPYFAFSSEPTIVMTDNKNLESFTATQTHSRRQARWSEFLSQYNSVIQHRLHQQNRATDALSRCDKPLREGGEAPIKTAMIPF